MYPRRSRFSPEIRPGNARQQLSMTIWACVFLASIVVMFAAFVLSGNFGVRELVCVMIGSGAAVVLGSQKATKTPVPAPRRRPSQAAKDSVLRPSEGVVAAHTTATISLSILTMESRVTSRSGRTRKTSSHSRRAPTMPSIRPVSSALSQRLSSLTSTRAAGSLRPSVRREPNAPRPRQSQTCQ